jgi:hypothetical protein
MLIVIPVIMILALTGVIMTLVWNRTHLKEELHAERTENSRVRVQNTAAKDALKVAEQKCEALVTGLHMAIGTTDKAVTAARQVEIFGAEMRRFFGMVLGPELESGRHSVPVSPLIPAPMPTRVLAQMPAPQPEPSYLPDDLDSGEKDEPSVYEHPYPHPGHHHGPIPARGNQQHQRSSPLLKGAVKWTTQTSSP